MSAGYYETDLDAQAALYRFAKRKLNDPALGMVEKTKYAEVVADFDMKKEINDKDAEFSSEFQKFLLGSSQLNCLVPWKHQSLEPIFPEIGRYKDEEIKECFLVQYYLCRLYVQGPDTPEECEHYFRYLLYPVKRCLDRLIEEGFGKWASDENNPTVEDIPLMCNTWYSWLIAGNYNNVFDDPFPILPNEFIWANRIPGGQPLQQVGTRYNELGYGPVDKGLFFDPAINPYFRDALEFDWDRFINGDQITANHWARICQYARGKNYYLNNTEINSQRVEEEDAPVEAMQGVAIAPGTDTRMINSTKPGVKRIEIPLLAIENQEKKEEEEELKPNLDVEVLEEVNDEQRESVNGVGPPTKSEPATTANPPVTLESDDADVEYHDAPLAPSEGENPPSSSVPPPTVNQQESLSVNNAIKVEEESEPYPVSEKPPVSSVVPDGVSPPPPLGPQFVAPIPEPLKPQDVAPIPEPLPGAEEVNKDVTGTDLTSRVINATANLLRKKESADDQLYNSYKSYEGHVKRLTLKNKKGGVMGTQLEDYLIRNHFDKEPTEKLSEEEQKTIDKLRKQPDGQKYNFVKQQFENHLKEIYDSDEDLRDRLEHEKEMKKINYANKRNVASGKEKSFGRSLYDDAKAGAGKAADLLGKGLDVVGHVAKAGGKLASGVASIASGAASVAGSVKSLMDSHKDSTDADNKMKMLEYERQLLLEETNHNENLARILDDLYDKMKQQKGFSKYKVKDVEHIMKLARATIKDNPNVTAQKLLEYY